VHRTRKHPVSWRSCPPGQVMCQLVDFRADLDDVWCALYATEGHCTFTRSRQRCDVTGVVAYSHYRNVMAMPTNSKYHTLVSMIMGLFGRFGGTWCLHPQHERTWFRRRLHIIRSVWTHHNADNISRYTLKMASISWHNNEGGQYLLT